MAFFNFIFNTLRDRINNPANQKFWLPKVLQEIDGTNDRGKLLPVTIGSWDIGEITGDGGKTITGSVISAYAAHLEVDENVNFARQKVIADPDDPNPHLSFLHATINGMHNQWVMADPPTQSGSNGYDVVLTLKSNHYAITGDSSSANMLGLTGRYLLSQRVGTADKSNLKKFNGNYTENIEGSGPVELAIINAYIQAELRIYVTGSGPERQIEVSVGKIVLLDSFNKVSPRIKIVSLKVDIESTFKNTYETAAKKAFSTEQASKGIFAQINHSLNQPGNLKALADAFSPQLRSTLDSMFGAVDPGGLPGPDQQLNNPADSYIFDRIRYALNQPGGDLYLPKNICALTQPQLEPFKLERIELSDQDVEGLTFSNINIQNISFTGLSNMVAPAGNLRFDADGNLDSTMELGALHPPPAQQFSGKAIPPPPFTGTGTFSMLPEAEDEPLTGTIRITVASGTIRFLTTFSGDNLSRLALLIKSATIEAAVPAIAINIGIGSSFFEGMINDAINTAEIKNQLLQKINEELSNNLGSMSNELTTATISSITSRLDA